MKALLALLLSAAPALAEPLARLDEVSGSVAPEYAWEWHATFNADATVEIKACKAYNAAGCATRTGSLTPEAFADLQLLLARITSEGSAPEDPDPPVGGGIRQAQVGAVTLPAFPLPRDAARVYAELDALAGFVPKEALQAAYDAAKAP